MQVDKSRSLIVLLFHFSSFKAAHASTLNNYMWFPGHFSVCKAEQLVRSSAFIWLSEQSRCASRSQPSTYCFMKDYLHFMSKGRSVSVNCRIDCDSGHYTENECKNQFENEHS